MSLPDAEAFSDLSLAELRALVGTLLAEVARLTAASDTLKTENQALKDEIARLKGLPPRPTFKPSGMDKATTPAAGPGPSRAKRGRGAKRLSVTDEQIVTAAVPAGSRFKGYEDVLVQDLHWAARVIRYRRERWLTPEGETLVAPLPAGTVGGFGPGLRRFHRRAVDITRQLIWWFYRDLKAYQRDPCRGRATALRARFDRIFGRRTGYVMLDRLLARLYRRKRELLRVLERPEIPLHTNGSENDIRACVTKRKVSGGTMSEAGRRARDVLLGLMKTCRKLGVSFVQYLGDRLCVPDAPKVAPLPDLIRHAAQA